MNGKNLRLQCVAAAIGFLPSIACQAVGGSVDIMMTTTATVHVVQMGEQTVTAMGGNGKLVFSQSSGGPFDVRDSAAVEYVGFSKTEPSGLELEADAVATFTPDDTLLLQFLRHPDDPGTSGEGNLLLTGGTGRFTGISGQCRYRTEAPSNEASVTIANCEWMHSFPYR
ncbi:MAG TPA: hypothetical protein VHB46_10430 [Burkholderiales bacterium]|nr:hypothetical protein [Burkholderiales bacterium]